MLSSSEFHRDFLHLRISTHEIGITGLNFSRDIGKEALSALIFEPNNETFSWKAESSLATEFSLLRENDHSFIVQIRANCVLSSLCVRCLNPVEHRFSIDFTVRMLEKERLGVKEYEPSNWQFDSTELEMADEDSSVGYFSEKCIDLGIILRDQIFLEVPDYPQCAGNRKTASCRTALSFVQDNEDKGANNPFVRIFKKTK